MVPIAVEHVYVHLTNTCLDLSGAFSDQLSFEITYCNTSFYLNWKQSKLIKGEYKMAYVNTVV